MAQNQPRKKKRSPDVAHPPSGFKARLPVLTAGVLALITTILYFSDQISEPHLVLALGFLSLGLLIFVTTRLILQRPQPLGGPKLTIALSLAWALVALFFFSMGVHPGSEVITISLKGQAKSPLFTAPGGREVFLMAKGALSVDGSSPFEGKYHIEVSPEQGQPALVEGTFSQSLGSRRVGRRQVSRVLTSHTINLHSVTLPPGDRFTLAVKDADIGIAERMEVTLFKPLIPFIAFYGLALVLVLFAFIVDHGWSHKPTKGLVPLAMFSSLLFVIFFKAWATPTNALRPLLGAAVLALLGGMIAGWGLSRLLRPLLKRLGREA